MKVSPSVLVVLMMAAALAACAGILIIALNIVAFAPGLWAARVFGMLVGAAMVWMGLAIAKMVRDIRKGMKSSAKIRFL